MSEIDSVDTESGYRLISLMSEGSRSRVYLADDSSETGRQVSVKFLREDEFPDNASASSHLHHESNCLSLASHANVVTKLNVAVNESGRPYLVTEYIRGQSLKQLLAESGLAANTAINLIISLTHAIENMHKIGVLHLDLRPDKIIVGPSTRDSNPKIIGFGRAKFLPWSGREQPVEPLPKSGLYSLQYISPEQVMEKRCLPASDVYALGCILYEALTGRPAIQGENELHVLAQHLSGKVQAPSAVKNDSGLKKYDEVVLQALAMETHKRFVDAAELREALLRTNPTGWMARLFKK